MTQLMKYIYSHFNRFLPSVKIGVFFVFSVVCTTLLREVRLHLGRTKIKSSFSLCSTLGLH